MSEYFLATTKVNFSRQAAEALDRQIKMIDPEMDFVSVSIPGNLLRGWIVRPNDGTNDYSYQRELNQRAAALLAEAEVAQIKSRLSEAQQKMNMTLKGYEAIEHAEKYDLTVMCYANAIDDGGEVTTEQARKIALEDPSLIYLEVGAERLELSTSDLANRCSSIPGEVDQAEPGFNQLSYAPTILSKTHHLIVVQTQSLTKRGVSK